MPPAVRIHLAVEPVDLRAGFDRLANLTREVLRQDPMSGHLFVFVSRDRALMKALFWDRSGFVVLAKRLEAGRYRLPVLSDTHVRQVSLEMPELLLLMEGIELAGAKKRRRWQPSPS